MRKPDSKRPDQGKTSSGQDQLRRKFDKGKTRQGMVLRLIPLGFLIGGIQGGTQQVFLGLLEFFPQQFDLLIGFSWG